MLNNPDIQPGVAVNRWIIGIKLFQFKLVHVPGQLHTGLDGLSCHSASPNDPIEEDEDVDDWLDRTMRFAIVLMNSQPSWSSRLTSSYCLNCQKYFPTYLIYLEDEVPEEVPPPIIPHSYLAQHANDHLDAVVLCYSTLLYLPTSQSLASTALSGMHSSSSFFWMESSCITTTKAVTKSFH